MKFQHFKLFSYQATLSCLEDYLKMLYSYTGVDKDSRKIKLCPGRIVLNASGVLWKCMQVAKNQSIFISTLVKGREVWVGEALAGQMLWINCGCLKPAEGKWASLLTWAIYIAAGSALCFPSLRAQNNLWIISPVNAFFFFSSESTVHCIANPSLGVQGVIVSHVWQGGSSQIKLELNPSHPAYGIMFIYISNWYFSNSCGPVHSLLTALQIINWEVLCIWLYRTVLWTFMLPYHGNWRWILGLLPEVHHIAWTVLL